VLAVDPCDDAIVGLSEFALAFAVFLVSIPINDKGEDIVATTNIELITIGTVPPSRMLNKPIMHF
jgi:hypothetical protein